jgi:hypothetical protein
LHGKLDLHPLACEMRRNQNFRKGGTGSANLPMAVSPCSNSP